MSRGANQQNGFKCRGAPPFKVDPLFLAALAIGLAFALIKLRPINGLFINSYPYISADGFDWIVEGRELWELVAVGNTDPWPSLRNPGFVLVTAADFAAQANGTIIIATQSLAIAATLCAIVRIGRLFGQRTAVIAVCLFGYTVQPLSYFNLWVLADPMCLGLMAFSVERLLWYQAKPEVRRTSIWVAALLALSAGLT